MSSEVRPQFRGTGFPRGLQEAIPRTLAPSAHSAASPRWLVGCRGLQGKLRAECAVGRDGQDCGARADGEGAWLPCEQSVDRDPTTEKMLLVNTLHVWGGTAFRARTLCGCEEPLRSRLRDHWPQDPTSQPRRTCHFPRCCPRLRPGATCGLLSWCSHLFVAGCAIISL